MVEIGENDEVTVIFDSYSEECITVPLEDVLPIGKCILVTHGYDI